MVTVAAKQLGDGQLRRVLDLSNVLTDGVSAMVDDSFTRCFTSSVKESRSSNVYLRCILAMDRWFRYTILFPLRLVLFVSGILSLVAVFMAIDLLVPACDRKLAVQRRMVQWFCRVFLMAWHGVIRYYGPKPSPGPNRVWVSNHTSMIDYMVLCSYTPFAVIQQMHHTWIAFLQRRVMPPLGCIIINRTDMKDRAVVAARMREHVLRPHSVPLLIFPEGTCVNTKYTIMFKQGAFDIGATVYPVALKYDDMFVDAFLNSGVESFNQHMFRLMTSWALLCDVYFLEPQTIQPGETPQEFAARVQALIAVHANLRVVPWDGYLRKENLAEKKPHLVEARRRKIADSLRAWLAKPSADDG